jgi:hypothetical protein
MRKIIMLNLPFRQYLKTFKIISKNLRLLSFTIIVICFTINTTNWYVFIRTNHWTFSIGSQCNITERINDKFMYTCTDTYYNASFFSQYLITLYDIFVTKATPAMISISKVLQYLFIV